MQLYSLLICSMHPFFPKTYFLNSPDFNKRKKTQWDWFNSLKSLALMSGQARLEPTSFTSEALLKFIKDKNITHKL